MPRITLTATIPAGQSLSGSIDLADGDAVFCHMPAAWTPALLSFQISYDNVIFDDLVDHGGREISLNIRPGTVIPLLNVIPSQGGWLKFRSGSRAGAITQTADRIFTLTVVTK